MKIKPDAIAAVMAAAEANLQAERSKPAPKRARSTILAPVYAAADAGKIARLTFTSVANPGYQKHADALFEMAVLWNLQGLKEYPISGSNTYAKALAGYREILVGVVADRESKLAHAYGGKEAASGDGQGPVGDGCLS